MEIANDIEKDAFDVCIKVLEKLERGVPPIFFLKKSDETVLFPQGICYKNSATPRFLIGKGILKWYERAKNNFDEYSVEFNYNKLKDWIDQVITGREQIRQLKTTKVKFDVNNSQLIIGGKSVKLPPNTNQYFLCKTISRSDKNKNKEWEWEDLLEDWGDRLDDFEDSARKKMWRRVYNAAREVNKKVQMETGEKDFILVIGTKRIKLNPKFI